MALLSTKGKVPEGAIILSENQAFEYQWKQVQKWPNFWDVWPFKIGIPLLAGIAVISSLRINSYIRSRLKLRHHGLYTSHLTVGIAATSLGGSCHYWYVTRDIMTYNASCPVCIETKAITIQLGGGIVYPCIISAFANFVLTFRYETYRLPDYRNFKDIFKLWIVLIKPLRKKLTVYLVLNIIAAGIITYAENESLYIIRNKMIERAQKVENDAKFEESKKLRVKPSE